MFHSSTRRAVGLLLKTATTSGNLLWENCKNLTSNNCLKRSLFYGRGGGPFWDAIGSLERQVRNMEREFDRTFKETSSFLPRWWSAADEWRPLRFGDTTHPASIETFRLRNPIVEEDGVKKMKLEFDVRRFKPDEVMVKTNSRDNTMTIEAKHESDEAKFQFERKLTLPEGVDSKDVTCKFTSDGVLIVQAPYTAPPELESPKDTEIHVKHD